jgi:HPt (histidine-containing phosphotransfer) domain-containing protein
MVEPIVVRVDRELSGLVPRFLGNCRRDVVLIEEALAKSDLDTTKKIGHSLKGVGGGYGFAEITRLGAAIEAAALAGDAQAALAGLAALAAYLDAVQVEYT